MNRHLMNHIQNAGLFTEIDIHFARLVTRLASDNKPEVFLAAALISSCTQKRHICLDLPSMAGKQIADEDDSSDVITCPVLDDWLTKLRSSSVVGQPGDYKPLILDNKLRLYLYRYWDYETKLVYAIKERIETDCEDIDFKALKDGLIRLFPHSQDDTIDWQKAAAFTAIVKRFCVITGGPGTGKTAAIARIMALLLEQDDRLKIALCAPTGKACARLQESIRTNKLTLNCTETIKKLIPETASTIHRLLKTIPNSPYFRHNANNLLPYNVVIVDEASMVDLALM